MNSLIIVGREDCPTLKVHEILRFSTSFHLFRGKWSDIARDLEIPEVDIGAIQEGLLLNKMVLSDVLKRILDLWVADNGDSASLEKLVQSLERNGLTDWAQRLRKDFQFYSVQTKDYVCIPTALNKLLNSVNFLSGLIILITPDITITMQKIKENLSTCETFSNYENLLKFVSTAAKWNIIVLTDDDPNTLANLLENMSGDRPFDQKGKVVFVTAEDEEKIKDFLTQQHFLATHNYVKLIRDEMEWSDLNLSAKHEVRKRAEDYIGFRLQNECLGSALSGQPLVDLINNGNDLRLIQSTLPDPSSYYVQRYLLTRNIISEDAFKFSGEDVFVFQGITRFELSVLIKGKLTANSSEQLQSLTTQFIVLDQLNHFTKITQLSNYPVHLIRLEEDGKWRWIKTSGAVDNIQKHVSKREAQEEIDELVLFRKMADITFEESVPVCISDSPGMGKSFLLAQIGRNLKANFPTRIVAFLLLPELIKELHRLSIIDLITSLKLCLTKLISETHLGELFIESTLNAADDKIWIELLLDGFDEVDYSDRSFSHEILRTIKSIKSLRMWVTSRPHLLEELERTLCVLGYNMQPFQEQNQIHFLTRFWGERLQMPDDLFVHFATTCLKVLKKNLDSCEEDIAGIPLQCLMIAEIFQDEAKSNTDSAIATSPAPFSFIDLYDLLIKKKIELFFQKYSKPTALLTLKEILDIHKWLGLQLLFPDYAEKVFPMSDAASKYSEKVLKIGLLEASSTLLSPRFIHRTFAEYLTAVFIIEMLQSKSFHNDFNILLYNKVYANELTKYNEPFKKVSKEQVSYETSKFLYPVICYFLNFLIPRSDNVCLPISNHLSYFSTTQEIILACVTHSFTNILKLFSDNKVVREFDRFIFGKNLLYAAVRFANLDLIKMVFAHFEKNHKFTDEVKKEVFRRAIYKMDFSVIEFILKKKKCDEVMTVKGNDSASAAEIWQLLVLCVTQTNKMNALSISSRLEIIRVLLNLNKDAEDNQVVKRLALEKRIHVQIIIELINLGADLLHSNGETLIHNAKWLNKRDYEKLIQYIPAEMLRQLVSITDQDGSTPLQILVEWIEPKFATLKTFKEAGADFNSFNNEGYSVLAVATKRRSRETLLSLVKFGADVNWIGESGESLLHLAAKYGNLEGVRYYLDELRYNVNITDFNWLTPLDYSIIYFDYKRNDEIEKVLNDRGGVSNIGHFYIRSNLKMSYEDLGAVIRKLVEHEQNDEVHFLRESFTKKSDNEIQDLLIVAWLEIIDRNIFFNFVDKIKDCSALSEDIVSQILKKGSDLFRRDDNGRLCLLKLLSLDISPSFFHKICEYLVAQDLTNLLTMPDGKKRLTLLHLAAEKIDLEEITLQLLCNANVSFQQVDKSNDNLLVYAIKGKRSYEMLKNLVKFGVDWKCRNLKGWNLLHRSVRYNNISGLKYFLNLSLSPNDVDNKGRSPLMLYLASRAYRNLELIKLLCESGADVNEKDCNGMTTLDYFIEGWQYNKGIEILKYLIENGANVYAKDDENCTFIHKWINKRYISPDQFHDFVEFLIQKKMSSALEVKGDFDNCTPVHLAMYDIEVEESTLALLHSVGFSFNSTDSDGDSLLTYAVWERRSLNVIDRLIKYGVDMFHLDKNGCNILHSAAQFGTAESLGFLIKKANIEMENEMERWTLLYKDLN